MAFLTRDQILAAASGGNAGAPLGFHSPLLGGEIGYRLARLVDQSLARRRATMPGEDGKAKEVDSERFDAALVALCCVGEDGRRLFTDQDVDALMEIPGGAREIGRLATAIMGAAKDPPK